MSKANLTKLIRKAINKDQSAITQLYEISKQKAYYIAISIMKNEEDAFDVLQNAYVKAFEKLNTLNNPEKFGSWLGQIVSNECNMALRKHKDILFSELETEDGLDLSETFKDERIEFSPDLNLDLEDTKKIVQAILDKLPDEQRLVILMYYFQDLSIKEIASILECSENTVKSRLNYAKKKIKSDVESLEKSGTKLYGIAPLPLFVWMLKQIGEKTLVPSSVSSALTTSITTSIANTVTVGATLTGATTTGVFTTGVVTKIITGCLALTVAVGGVALYFRGQDSAEPTEQSSTVTTVTEKEHTASNSSLNDQAMQAYDALLSRGYTDKDMTIYYYTYLDINRDGVNELIVADNKGTPDAWTICELYSYDENGLVFCGSTNSRYDYLYYVNEEYVLGKHRMGDQYLSITGLIDFDGNVETSEIIELQETPYTAFEIGITEAEILQIFYSAKDFYDLHIYGKRFLESAYYSASDINWIEGVIEYNGGLYAPCNEYTYDEFVEKLQSLFTIDTANRLIDEVGLIEYNGKCYTYIREGVGDPILGDYEVSVQLKGNVIFEIQVSFTALDGSVATEYVYCQQENDVWVIDGIDFYGQ